MDDNDYSSAWYAWPRDDPESLNSLLHVWGLNLEASETFGAGAWCSDISDELYQKWDSIWDGAYWTEDGWSLLAFPQTFARRRLVGGLEPYLEETSPLEFPVVKWKFSQRPSRTYRIETRIGRDYRTYIYVRNGRIVGADKLEGLGCLHALVQAPFDRSHAVWTLPFGLLSCAFYSMGGMPRTLAFPQHLSDQLERLSRCFTIYSEGHETLLSLGVPKSFLPQPTGPGMYVSLLPD